MRLTGTDRILVALALTNVAAGIWLSAQPARSGDLHQLAGWAAAWGPGVDPYSDPDALVDYPPWALVLLRPLGLVAPGWRAPFWIAVNLGLAASLVWTLVTMSGEAAPWRGRLALLLASTACLRSLTQFSLASFTLALVGAGVSNVYAGGLVLGLALFKPQIAGVVWLWCALRRQWSRVAVAAIVPVAIGAIYVAWVSVSPSALASEYLNGLSTLYGDPTDLHGHTELRPWLWRIWPGASANVWMTVALGAALLAPVLVAAARSVTRDGVRAPSSDRTLEWLAMCGVVSLLVVRHMSSDFLLMLPVLVAWRAGPFTARATPLALGAAFVLTGALLIAAVPSWARLAVQKGADARWLFVTECDRALCVGVWIVLAWRMVGTEPASSSGKIGHSL